MHVLHNGTIWKLYARVIKGDSKFLPENIDRNLQVPFGDDFPSHLDSRCVPGTLPVLD